MALGDSYPVELLDDQGNPVATEVAAVQFTDGDDQPSRSGGGSQPYPIKVTFLPDWNAENLATGMTVVPNTLVGDGTTDGTAASGIFTSPPFVYAAGDVVAANTIVLSTSGEVASTEDALDLIIRGAVTDQDGSNSATIQATFSLPSPVTDCTAVLDLTDATWNIDAGDDLTNGVNGNLVSAAGGAYTVAFSIAVAWD